MASKNAQSNLPAKTGTAGLPATSNSGASLPAFMQGSERTMDHVDVEDLIIPRVALMQGISPAVMAGQVENGHFWHTILEEDLGTKLRVAPLLYRKQYALWNPQHAGGGIIARASDGRHWDTDIDATVAPYKDFPKRTVRYQAAKGDLVSRDAGLGAWGSMDPDNADSGPAATVSHIFLMRALDFMHVGPFVVYLQRSSERVARNLLSSIRMVEDGVGAPSYGQVFEMSSKVVPNNAGQEYNQYEFPRAAGDGRYVTDEALFLKLKAEHEQYKQLRFRTNDEDADREAGSDNGGGAKASAGADSQNEKY